MPTKRIVFIAGSLSQPRILKRINALNLDNFEIVVYGYSRGQYTGNKLPEGIKTIELRKLNDGKDYLKKAVLLFFDSCKIIRQNRGDNTLFYIFDYLNAIPFLFSKRKYVYEVSDILYSYPNFRYMRRVLRMIDRYIINRSFFTVMTSKGFEDFLNVSPQKVVIQPNRINPVLRGWESRNVVADKGRTLRFGFVGALRYQTVYTFAKLIGEFFLNYEFHFFGESSQKEKFIDLSKEYPNVFYHGAYINPRDLPDIYSSIDVIVATYDNNSLNERIAEPNKFYEALFFSRPIIVSGNTYLAERVKYYDSGYVLEDISDEGIKEFLFELKPEDVYTKQEQLHLINKEEFIDDHSELISQVKGALC